MKKFFIGLLSLAVLIAVAVLIYAFIPTRTHQIASLRPGADKALVQRGRYLATAGDCVTCHTAPGGKQFAGGLAIASPLGSIYSTNITPDRETGVGTYTLDDFDRAVRHGLAKDGSSLYPAMPYPSYARIDDDDVQALYAYFINGVAPVRAENRAAGIPWPLSMRWPLAIWRKTFAPSVETVAFDPKRYPNAKSAHGAYLVQGLGHCGSCHTPRAVTLQEKALDDSSEEYLSGGQVIDGWFAVNLRGNEADGLGNWSAQDIVDTLKGARNIHAAVIGQPMSDVVVHSTQHLTDDDLESVASYLKMLAPAPTDKSGFKSDPATAAALRAGIDNGRGAELYVDNCSACHRTDGKGYANVFPEIADNSSVLADDPTSLVHLILAGGSLPSTAVAPSPLGMPGFGQRLKDEEVAQLVTFIRNSWGNHASNVAAALVSSIRKQVTVSTQADSSNESVSRKK
jgi:mono/diheme cytochrome c family protein